MATRIEYLEANLLRSHGTFRPSLRSLVASNTSTQIETTSQEAFALLPLDFAADLSKPLDLTPAISKLSTLRGIGPATASLLLNTHSPADVPFFSDELYRWLRFSDASDVKGPGKGTKGWERRIGYTGKEYMELVRRTCTFRDRLRALGRDAGARDIECVAYVLGKTGGGNVPIENGGTDGAQLTQGATASENEGFEALARGVMAAIDKEHARSVEERAGGERTGNGDGIEEGEQRRKRRRKEQ